MRAIWKGAISFGLVSIGIKLYSATEEKNIHFHQVHREDGGRITYERICSVDGAEIAFDDIAKGYDLGGGEMVILTDEDFAHLPLPTSHAIDVLGFAPAEQIDPILYAKAYYLEPDGAATKPYLLLRDALTSAERVAIVKVTLRQREQLGALRVRDGVIVLNTMLWPDEVRAPEFTFLTDAAKLRPAERAMATSLVDSMVIDFRPDDYADNYREALQAVIDAKVSGKKVVAPKGGATKPTPASDLMSVLTASVARAKAGHTTPAKSARPARAKPASRKAPAAKRTRPTKRAS